MLQLCIPALGTAIPPFRSPKFLYGSEGCVGFFESKFQHVLESDELEAHVFHCLREVGNALAFVLLLSDALVPPTRTPGLSVGRPQSSLPTTISLSSYPPSQDERRIQSHELQHGGVFQRCLQELHARLHRTGIAQTWHAAPHSHPERMPSSAGFYHVWHALEFLACTPGRTSDSSVVQSFGDGVQLAGCAIIHVLDQRSLYELWNVNRHVLSVWRHEQTKQPRHITSSGLTTSSSSGDSVQSVGSLGREMRERTAVFAANALAHQRSTVSLFHVLETAWPRPRSAAAAESMAPCRPPSFVPQAPSR